MELSHRVDADKGFLRVRLVFEPRKRLLAVAVAVYEDDGRYGYLEDIEHIERVLEVYASPALLPFALNHEAIGELLAVEHEEVAPDLGAVDAVAYDDLLGVLLPAYGVPIGEHLLLVVPKLRIALLGEDIFYEAL